MATASIKFFGNEQSASAGDGVLIDHISNSGLGFFGNGYKVSVPIGSQNVQTWITDGDGENGTIRLHNTRYADEDGGANSAGAAAPETTLGKVSIDGGSEVDLTKLPNAYCPLRISFEYDGEPVKVQNCKLRIFDRENIDQRAVDVITYVYEARHPSLDQVSASKQQTHRPASSLSGGGQTWVMYDERVLTDTTETVSDMFLTESPGASGLNSLPDDTNNSAYLTSLGFSSAQISAHSLGKEHTSLKHDWYLALSSEPAKIGSKTRYGLYFSVEFLT
jgi:hypothetical protein